MLRVIALAVVILFPSPAYAQTREEARRASLKALYRLDYAVSMEHIRGWIRRSPEDPFGYLFEAGVLWWMISMDPASFRADKKLKPRFLRDLKTGLKLAKPGLRSSDKKLRADSHFITGLLLGIRSQWNLSNSRYLRAFFDGRKGKKFQKRCLEADPTYADAFLGIGLFEYLAGRLPGVLYIPSFIIRGDVDSGKRNLHKAMDEGRYPFAGSQAASNLVSLYILYEKEYGQALEINRRLLDDFPDSPYFRFLDVMILDLLGHRESSIKKAHDLFSLIPDDPGILVVKRMGILCGLQASKCLKPEVLKRPIEWMSSALSSEKPAPAGFKTLLHLYRGVALDILKRREEAKADYEAVLAAPNIGDSHDAAAQCLRKRCSRRAALKLLRKKTKI
jgi:tetratricopeptide (TPR) repeat protein